MLFPSGVTQQYLRAFYLKKKGYRYKEIAFILKVSPECAKKMVERAKKCHMY